MTCDFSGSAARQSRRVRTIVTLALATLVVTGCATRGGKIAYDPPGFVAPDVIKPAQIGQDYKLGVGDTITVRVYKVDGLSGDQTINATGRISLPLVGDVQAAGLTTSELEKNLVAALGTRYLQNPQVLVAIKAAVQKTVTVDGSVLQPGLYPVQPNTTLIQTIAMARGPAEDANPRRIVVFRQINGQKMAAAFDLISIRRNESPDPTIYADDVIVVEGSRSSKAFKQILSGLPFAAFFKPF